MLESGRPGFLGLGSWPFGANIFYLGNFVPPSSQTHFSRECSLLKWSRPFTSFSSQFVAKRRL